MNGFLIFDGKNETSVPSDEIVFSPDVHVLNISSIAERIKIEVTSAIRVSRFMNLEGLKKCGKDIGKGAICIAKVEPLESPKSSYEIFPVCDNDDIRKKERGPLSKVRAKHPEARIVAYGNRFDGVTVGGDNSNADV
jgi:SepF-like predicted cell division protein (DUF552 family)